MADFSLVGLQVIREVARSGSLTAAAAQLGYTQSAISRQVGHMERAAGKRLFERHARGVRPTEAGEILLRRADAVLAAIETTRAELDDLDAPPRVRLRVGAFATALAALVPRAIAASSARHSGTEVLLREGTSPRLVSQVADGRLAMAVVTASEPLAEQVTATTLLEDPLLVAVSRDHALAGRRSVPADELREARWVAGTTDTRSPLLGAWTGSPWQPEIAYVARDWTAKLGLVATGLGITVVPGLAVPMLPTTVSIVRIDHPAATRSTLLVTGAESPSDGPHRHLVEALRDAAAEIAADVRGKLRD
jgi:DNA-binding transcriptional LysR family regulator